MFDDLEGFKRGQDQFIKELKTELTGVIRVVAKNWFLSTVKRTPVDTGFARMGWQYTINHEPPLYKVKHPGTGVFPAPTSPKFLSLKYGDVVYLFNNVEYIEKLEHGSSSQAPRGMLAISTLEARERLSRVLRSIKVGD